MAQNKLINNAIFSKKTQDYTIVILFLVIFSIFIIAAIKPSLTTAFSLKKEEADLLRIDSLYEEKISNITDVQSQVEENRGDLYLIDEAVSVNPEVNKMFDDVKKIADKNNFFIKKANIADVNLINNNKSLEQVSMTVDGTSDFSSLMMFINDLYSQRRLKMIKSLKISLDKDATLSSGLKISLIIDGYYL